MASNKMLIDASHREETRVVVLRGNRIEEFDFESQNKQQLKGNIYLAKVTRVEPSLQAAFVDYGGNRHGFLAFNEIHPDYYQIPVADRQALIDEETADARRDDSDEDENGADEITEIEAIQVEENQPIVEEEASVEVDENDSTIETKPKRKPRRTRKRSVKPPVVLIEADDATAENSDAKSEAIVVDVEKPDSANEAEEKSPDSVVQAAEPAVKKPRAKRSTRRTKKPAAKVAEELEVDQSSAESADAETALKESGNAEAVSSKNDQVAETAEPLDEAISSIPEKPSSIAAMMETDSISEPAPDDDNNEEESENADEPDLAQQAPAPKKRSRSTRRPRKKVTTEAPKEPADEAIIVNAEMNDDAVAPEIEANQAQAEVPDTAKEAKSEKIASVDESDNSDVDNEDAPKPKTRRRRRSQKNAAKSNDDAVSKKGKNVNSGNKNSKSAEPAADQNGNDDSDEVQWSGQEDAFEEVPQRRRPRRQYKIQEVVKRRQVLLVQVVKEERGNKGAALTTYLSLAGRYSVLMPNTARGGGISRKITNTADRKRLKTIASELEVPEGMGVILRTAGASRTKEEIQRDFEYLMRLWENVRSLTLSSSAPCLVYEEGSLIKRSIRDLYDKNTGEVIVAGEAGFNEAKDFMTMLMPSHANKVSLYQEEQAMLARFGVEQQLDKMLSQQVTLKSGGYLVIDQTEALVAIDVNSGRATREHSIEDTALQTNLETAEEVARQLRLRDLAGLIVIDFIDMEEKRNNRAVEKKLKECLKHDRARIQVGRISHFGLLEMSRQRMRASVLDSTMEVCPHCQGKGHIRSNSSVGLHLLRAMEEHLLKNSRFDLMITVATDIASYILNHKRNALLEIEERFGVKIVIDGRHDLLGEDYNIEKGEPSTGERKPVNHIQVGQISDMPPENAREESQSENQNAEENSGKRKRRRRRGRNNKDDSQLDARQSEPANEQEENENEPDNRKRQRGKRAGRGKKKPENDLQASDVNQEADIQDRSAENQPAVEEVQHSVNIEQVGEEVQPAKRNRRPRKPKPKPSTLEVAPENSNIASDTAPAESSTSIPEPSETTENQPEIERTKRRTTRRRPARKLEDTANGQDNRGQDSDSETKVSSNETGTQESQTQSKTDEVPASAEAPEDGSKKRGGWWSRNGFFK